MEPWRWRKQEALDGLSVLCMDEAEDGSLWFGNVGSIAHYDGRDIKSIPFDKKLIDKISLQRKIPWAKSIKCLSNKRLLVQVGRSVVMYAEGEWRVLIKNIGISLFLPQFLESDNGTVWLLTRKGLWRFDADFKRASQIIDASDLGYLLSYSLDSSGNIWILHQRDENKELLLKIPVHEGTPAPQDQWKTYPSSLRKKERGTQITCGDDGMIWYIAEGTPVRVRRFDPEQSTWLKPFPAEKGSISHCSLFKQSDGSILVGRREGIARYSKEGKQSSFLFNTIGVPNISYRLFETSDHRIWIIGSIGYVYSVDLGTTEWETFPGLNYQCETLNAWQWFVSWNSQQVVSYNPHAKEWMQYTNEELKLDKILALFYSSHDLIWATGMLNNRAAILVFNGTKWLPCKHPKIARIVRGCRAFEAQDGTVWFGAGGRRLKDENTPRGGALQFRVNKDSSVELIKHYDASMKFDYYVAPFEQTPDGLLWLGSSTIHTYDGKSPQASPELSLPQETTSAMVLDTDKKLWIAKKHVGIYRQKSNKKWDIFTRQDGLAGLNIIDLILLQDGSLLASSDRGISRFDGTSWTAMAYPPTLAAYRTESKMYQSTNGDLWFNYEFLGKQKDIFPEQKGFCTVRHRPERMPPDTKIEHYLEQVSSQGNSHISWSGSDLWSSTPQSQLQFSWCLDNGLWSPFSHATAHTFLTLKRGKHLFKVRARDRAFNVDPSPVHVEFNVVPPVWMQAWFLILLLLFLGLILYLIWLLIRGREQHILEQQREREHHLLELDQLKTGFFSNISHELRTPLSVISGRVEILLLKEKDESKKRGLSIIHRNTNRLANLVSQLLDLQKIDSKKLRIQLSKGNLASSLEEWISSLGSLAWHSNISIDLVCTNACLGSFDFDKIQKIVTNLISNAIKYTEKQGHINVQLSLCDDREKSIRLTVEDNGVGIQPKHLDHIFDRFYRISEESLTVGAGIGLDLTKELVDLLEGSITVESPIYNDPNRPGTRFTVELPIKEESKQQRKITHKAKKTKLNVSETSLPKSSQSKTDKPLILIVEDDEEIRDMMIESLNTTYQIAEAENGKIGLKIATMEIPELVITDLIMPELDGIEMSRQLKKSMTTSHIPIIMLTAKASVEHQLEGLQIGVEDYITKPFHMELLKTRIANLLQSRRLLREKYSQSNPILEAKIPEETLDKAFFDRVMQTLETHYTDSEFTLDAFAAALHMSLSTLKRKLKAVADRTPRDLLNEFRMMKAAKHLTQSSGSITEISYEVGCDNASNFSRLFKKYYDLSPTNYRETHCAE